jgi:hypothetical protein
MLSSKPQDNYIMLYARVTMDTPSLDTIMGAKAGMGESDESTGTLWRGWKNSWEHGVVQVHLRPLLTFHGSSGIDGALWPTTHLPSEGQLCSCI